MEIDGLRIITTIIIIISSDVAKKAEREMIQNIEALAAQR